MTFKEDTQVNKKRLAIDDKRLTIDDERLALEKKSTTPSTVPCKVTSSRLSTMIAKRNWEP
jgi:hypothetical protein